VLHEKYSSAKHQTAQPIFLSDTLPRSWGEASTAGYLSRTALKARGLKPVESGRSGVVVDPESVGLVRRSDGLCPWYVIVEDDGSDLVKVSTRSWEVFHQEDTIPVHSEPSLSNSPNSLQESSHSHSSFPPTTFPRHVQERERKPIKENDLRSKTTDTLFDPVISGQHEKTKATRRSVTGKGEPIYLPEVGVDLPSEAEAFRPEIEVFLHVLYMERVLSDDITRHDYVRLSSKVLERDFPNYRRWRPMIEGNVFEIDGTWQQDVKCLGFRPNETIRQSIYRVREITDVAMAKRLRKWRSEYKKNDRHRYLADMLTRFDFDLHSFDTLFGSSNKFETYREPGQMIADKFPAFLADDFSGRCHSAITRLLKPARHFLRVDGQPVAEIDLKCSQPFFVAVAMHEAGISCPSYFEAVETGTVYKPLMRATGMSKGEVKEAVFKMFFASNRHTSKVKREFARLWPEVSEFMHNIKAKPTKPKRGEKPTTNPGGREFARVMQIAERQFVIDAVVPAIRKAHKGLAFATIHDAVICRADMAREVERIIRETAEKVLPLKLSTSVSEYDRAWCDAQIQQKNEERLGWIRDVYLD